MTTLVTAAPLDWPLARAATAHCLLGCTAGEVVGLLVGRAAGWSTPATIAFSVGLAFVLGFALAAVRLRRTGLPWPAAARIAVPAEVLSIATMELVANAVVLFSPGALDASPIEPRYWVPLVVGLAVAFVLTVPINAWLIARGRGHALGHAGHQGHADHAGYGGPS